MNKKTQLLIIAVISIINALIILLIFSNDFFNTLDYDYFNLRLILIILIPLTAPLVYLGKIKGEIKLKNILVITFCANVGLILFLTLLNIGLTSDVEISYVNAAQHILNGDYCDPFPFGTVITWDNEWRVYPPGSLIWFTFNYLIHGFNPFCWRLINLILILGIIVFIKKIGNCLNIKENILKNGLIFFIISAVPFIFSILWGQYDCFTVFLSIGGIYFIIKGYNREKFAEKYLYLGIALLTFAALVKIYSLVWIFGIVLFLIKHKEWTILLRTIVIGLLTGFIICSPFILMNSEGFITNLLIFVSGVELPNAPYFSIWNFPKSYGILAIISVILIATFVIIYLYKLKSEKIDLDFFIIIICIFVFFSAWNLCYIVLWFLPLIHVYLLKSYHKFKITTIILYIFIYAWMLNLAIAGLFFPESEPSINYIFEIYMTLHLDLINKVVINSILYIGILNIIKTTLSQHNMMFILNSRKK